MLISEPNVTNTKTSLSFDIDIRPHLLILLRFRGQELNTLLFYL